MDKYCSAGKIECENYQKQINDIEELCKIEYIDNDVPMTEGLGLTNFEVCPWPSRQVPVNNIAAEIAEMPDGLYIVDETPVEKPPDDMWIMEYSGGFYDLPGIVIFTNQRTGERQKFDGTNWEKIDPVQTTYQAGRSDMKREIGEKVKGTIEKLSDIEHQRWAKWQKYLHSKCVRNENGSLTIPYKLRDRWENQIYTTYEELSEHEKEMDRREARRSIVAILAAVEEVK